MNINFFSTKKNSLKLYLQLLEILTIREIKSRYRASILGPLWIIIQPFFTALFLTFIFEKILKLNFNNIPYFLFLYSGLLIWNFFEQSINLAKESLVWNRQLITKSKFEKSALPLSFIFSKIPDFFVNLLIFLFLMIFFKQKTDYILIILSFLSIIPLILFSSSIGLIFSSLNAIFRDFGRIIDFLILISFYITPVIYSSQLVPQKLKIFLSINPLFYIIEFNRKIFFEKKIEPSLIIYSFIISFFLFLGSFFIFKKLEKKVVDLI